jgi:tetratricopeptide (TPR) repeat protein
MHLSAEISSWIKKNWIYIAILWVLVAIVYFNSIHNELVSDDIAAIKDSEKLLATPGYFLQFPRFITRSFLYYLSYQLNGTSPVVYHLINILFHLGTVSLIYTIVPYFSKKKYLPFIVASFAAVHPIMVESVTWISGGIYAQSAFFLLLSFLLYIRNHIKYKKSQAIWAVILFVCALSSSEKVIIYPALLFLYEYCFFSVQKNWKKIIPYFLVCIVWLFFLIPEVGPRMEAFKQSRGAALEFYNPFLQIPNAVGGYIRLLIWPDILSIYHYDLLLSFGNIIINSILFIIFIIGIIYSFKKNKLIFFWLSFFVISLGVTLNPFGLSWIVAERYAYLGMIGLYFIIGYYLTNLFEKKRYKETGYIVFGIIILILSIRTIFRNSDWRNTETLWTATAKASPNYVASQNNLANIYVLNGEYDKAVVAYKTAITLNPRYSYSYYNLGYTLRMLKRHNEAIPALETAIKLNPSYWQSYEQLGGVYFELGKFGESELYIRRALQLQPNASMLWAQLGTLEQNKGNTSEAITDFKKALMIDPKNSVAYQSLQKLQ